MDIPSASGFRSDNGSTTLLSSPRSGQRFQTSAVTLPQASFKPMDVTLKLRSAVYFADVAKARVAILAGADVNSSNPENHNETMLHTAALEGNLDIAQLLLENKADVNKTNDCGESPLHLACFEENDDMIRLLVSFGADPNLQDEDGNTPADHMSIVQEQPEEKQSPMKLLEAASPRRAAAKNAAAIRNEPAEPVPAEAPKGGLMRLRVGSSRSPKFQEQPKIRSLNSLDTMGPLPSPRRGHAAQRTPVKKAAAPKVKQPLPIEVDLIWTMIEGLSAEHREILKERLLEED